VWGGGGGGATHNSRGDKKGGGDKMDLLISAHFIERPKRKYKERKKKKNLVGDRSMPDR